MSLAAAGTPETPEIRPCQKFEGHTDWVTDVIHLPGEQQIMTSSYDDSLRVWNLQSGKQIGNEWGDEGGKIALSPDGQKVVRGDLIGDLKLWDTNTSKAIAEWEGHMDHVNSVCWSRDGGRVMSGSADGTARVWDMESGKIVLAIETGLGTVEAVIYSPDMTMVGTGGESEDLKEFIKIWDAKTGKLITNLKGHTWKVFCLAWTADGSETEHEEIKNILISGSYDFSIRTWNTTTWQQIHVLTGHTNPVCRIAISPNGPVLASASWDNTVRLWNLENGLPIGSPLQHSDTVQCVSFSTDGKLLATGCWDNNAYSWDISGILEEAGLLNQNDGDKSLIDADATRHAGHRRRDVHRVPPKFFDDAPYHPRPSRTHHLSASSSRQYNITGHPSSHRRAHLGRLSSLFQRNNYNTHDAPPRASFLEWARSTSFHLPHRRDNEGSDLQTRLPAVVDVPAAQGNYRNYSAREARKEKEKEKEMRAKNAKNAQNKKNTTNARGAAQAQPTSQVHAATSTLSTTPAAATSAATTTASRPDAMIPRAGRWTRFWLSIGCVSAQYTDVQ